MAKKYGSDKELTRIFEALVDQGWDIRRTSKSHWDCYSPDGKTIVRVGGTLGSAYRAIANFKAALRRAGAKI